MKQETKERIRDSIIIIGAAALILGVVYVLCYDPFKWFGNEDPANPIDDPTVVVVDPEDVPENKKLSANGNWMEGTEKMNAYDFIIKVMSEPQYWGEEARHPYAGAYNGTSDKELYDPLLTEQNITGWILLDEDTATFRRGVTCDYQLNFSAYTTTNYQYEEWQGYNSATVIDLNAGTHITYRRVIANTTQSNGSAAYTCHEETIDLDEDRQLLADLKMDYSLPLIAYDTFAYYEELFEFVGCPLLNQPEGTLASYKNKTIKVPIKVDTSEGKIHYIWEFENFSFNFWESDADSIQWLDDYRDIFDQKVPESELSTIYAYDENGDLIESGKISKASNMFLCFANKDTVTEQYFSDSPLWDPLQHEFIHQADAVALYILQPMMEELYGYSTVYFTDVNQVLVGQDVETNLKYGMSVSDFKNNLQISDSDSDLTIQVDPYADERHVIGNKCYTTAFDYSGYRDYISYYLSDFEYLNKEYPFTYDYFQYFVVYYDMDLQRCLGLR